MRAPTTSERIGGMLQSAFGGLAQQPLARIADLTGLTDFKGVSKSFSTPDTGIRNATVPFGPFKSGGKSIQLIDDAIGPGLNASGESMASVEAINRMRSMAGKGEQFVVRKGGTTRPLIGPEAVDYRPRPGEEYGVMRNGVFQLLQRGGR